MVAQTLSSLRFHQPVAEISLLLPTWQVSALEQQAYSHGLTVAEMLRELIRQHLGASAGAAPSDSQRATVSAH